MKYRLVVKKDPMRNMEEKFYANAVKLGTKDIFDIADLISGRSSLTCGDILNVLSNFLDEGPPLLRDGFSVQLGELGTLRITLASNGAATKKEFHAESIKPRVIFRPSARFMKRISDNHYEAEGKKKE